VRPQREAMESTQRAAMGIAQRVAIGRAEREASAVQGGRMCVKKNKICSEMHIQISTSASRLGFLLLYSYPRRAHDRAVTA
jgi:hypothetical protein